jgi:hypothetical protein
VQLKFLDRGTPNFSLTVDDIPYNPPRAVGEQSPPARLTLQYFASEDRLGHMIIDEPLQSFSLL